ncbi:MAG TPA: GNAT family N-acetyltransferase [Thermoanaerobaculia bacterium]|nr:GNAT family N-acetyltransferase [Thermoanaerobaculia bacterium]
MAFPVSHNAEEKQFESRVDGELAVLTYDQDDGRITFTHTLVPKKIERRGIGTELVRQGLAHARAEKLQVIPQCPFVAAHIKRTRDGLDLLDANWRQRLE